MGAPEEGDKCRHENCIGKLEYQSSEECTCHLNPPCWACSNRFLTCTECGDEPERNNL